MLPRGQINALFFSCGGGGGERGERRQEAEMRVVRKGGAEEGAEANGKFGCGDGVERKGRVGFGLRLGGGVE